jgi:hypothetical protein
MVLEVKKNKKFFFKYFRNNKIAFLFLRKNHSNFFMTLTDRDGRVITCKTAATVIGKSERRRRRKAPQTMEYMINSLEEFFILYEIWGLCIFLQMRPGQYIKNIIQSLNSRKISLFSIYNFRKNPYSYTRGRRKKI